MEILSDPGGLASGERGNLFRHPAPARVVSRTGGRKKFPLPEPAKTTGLKAIDI
jgi:hypothetical protein